MTWLISNAMMQAYENSHFSPEPVEEFLEAICSDGEPSALSSGSHTLQAYCAPDRMTAFSRLSRFGMTFAPLTDGLGEELLTWFLEDSRARTSAWQEQAQGLTESAAASGQKWPASLAKYAPATHSLKTAQLSLLEGSTECSVTLPRSGSMRNGECFLQPILVRLTCANESGSSERIPTPTVGDAKSSGSRNTPDSKAHAGISLTDFVRKDGGAGRETWPTPTASLGTKGGRVTPRKGREGGTSIEAVSARAFPTPTATMHKGWSPGHNRADSDDQIDYTIEREAAQSGQNGRLNPTWVEWLMAWPLGWTDLKPLETAKFLEWQRQHSIYFAKGPDGNV